MVHAARIKIIFSFFCISFIYSLLAFSVHQGLTLTLDTSIESLAVSVRLPLLTECMLFITTLGNNSVAMVLTFLSLAILFFLKEYKHALYFFIIMFISAELNTLLKIFHARERPTLFLIEETFFSFPSSHAMNSFVFFNLLLFFSLQHIKKPVQRRLLSLLTFVFIFLMGMSRVYLGVHYITDVIGGWLAGSLVMIIFYSLYRSITTKKFLHSSDN